MFTWRWRNLAGVAESSHALAVCLITDIRDYVNGIGNRSHERYVCIERWPRTPCYYSEADGFVKLYVY